MAADERRAVGLYAVGARDWCDFIDMVKEEKNTETIELLHEMLTTPNPDMKKEDAELNALLAPFVSQELERRKNGTEC